MKGWLLALLGLVLVACVPVPQLGPREALPTAGVAVVASGPGAGTPVPRRAKSGGVLGAVPTPAPWATPLPPTPRSAPFPPIEHPTNGRFSSCLNCHGGVDSSDQLAMPQDHYMRSTATCLGCHTAAGGQPG